MSGNLKSYRGTCEVCGACDVEVFCADTAQCITCYADGVGHGGEFESSADALDQVEQACGKVTDAARDAINLYFRAE